MRCAKQTAKENGSFISRIQISYFSISIRHFLVAWKPGTKIFEVFRVKCGGAHTYFSKNYGANLFGVLLINKLDQVDWWDHVILIVKYVHICSKGFLVRQDSGPAKKDVDVDLVMVL